LIEAWANRKPVIAADIAVSRELIASSNGGVTTPFGNAQQLAASINRLLSDSSLQQSMGAAGYNKALEYQGDAPWQRLSQEFEHVAAAK